MFIQPMNGMHLVGQINGLDAFKERTAGLQDSFLGVFKDAINNVRETDLKAKENAILTATGNEGAIHNSLIDAEKAQISLELLIQLRNKTIEAYNEITRMQI